MSYELGQNPLTKSHHSTCVQEYDIVSCVCEWTNKIHTFFYLFRTRIFSKLPAKYQFFWVQLVDLSLSFLCILSVCVTLTAWCRWVNHCRLSCSSVDINVCDWPKLESLNDTLSKFRAEKINKYIMIYLKTGIINKPHNTTSEIAFFFTEIHKNIFQLI
jgi:hypothetical protein